jgi:hypothetical protein
MAKCENCGNEYDKSFEMIMGGKSHTFDSFECAIHKLAPKCALCGCRITWAWCRAAKPDILLRSLCARAWGNRIKRPRLNRLNRHHYP